MPNTTRAASPAKKKVKKSARKLKSSRKVKGAKGGPNASFNPELLPGSRLQLSLPKQSDEIVFGVAMNSNPESGVACGAGLTRE